VRAVIINISPDSKGEANRDRPESALVLSVGEVHELIGLKIKIYFTQEGSIGQEQIKKKYEFGVLISVARDADRKNFLFFVW
jgi:hypothetical protein